MSHYKNVVSNIIRHFGKTIPLVIFLGPDTPCQKLGGTVKSDTLREGRFGEKPGIFTTN